MNNAAPKAQAEESDFNKETAGVYTTSLIKKIVSFLLFQLGWFCCLMLPINVALFAVIAFIVVHVFWIIPVLQAWKWIVRITILGWAMDAIIIRMGIIQVLGNVPLPSWLMCLWVMFACTAITSLLFLIGRPWLAAILSFAGASTSYFAGGHLSSTASLGENPILAAIVIGLCWSVFIPFVFELIKRDGVLQTRLNF